MHGNYNDRRSHQELILLGYLEQILFIEPKDEEGIQR